MERADKIGDWLVAEGPHGADMGALLGSLAERLLAAGIPVARMATMIETPHPRFIGAMRVWEPGGDVRLRRATFDDPAITAAAKRFTIDEVQETGDWVDFKLDDPRIGDDDLLPRLAQAGHTHYLLMPLEFREGPLQGISFSTKQAGGFTAAQRQAIRKLQPSLALTANAIATHTMWREVLKQHLRALRLWRRHKRSAKRRPMSASPCMWARLRSAISGRATGATSR